MRIISVKTLKSYCKKFPLAEQALLSWYEEMEAGLWHNSNELKVQYRHASIVANKRVIFNIHGNSYRLVVDIEYRLKIVFMVWFGTHKEYDKIEVKKISYGKANKK